ncbi:NIPA-like protein 2 [Tritrichomonas foetus]|uniref:NIPA-like protein 2 n=1 Tax=Tritrichomonas foetus TaxID=1144522 RepID=A0A1J4JND5_9EUKA|nr:NIPA-like protein 2 [Tritrichomonas foetus]|eukprot:OHS99051.1 NIPA-like protein 2 [Tritrichomonas foetus]
MKSSLLGALISMIGQSCSALGMNLQRYAHTMKTSAPLIKRWPFILGVACTALTEAFNFVALSFAPVSTIAPLGSLSIIFSAIFGQLFFSENVKPKGIQGIILISCGTILTVINGPSNSKDLTVDEFQEVLKSPSKIVYFGLLVSIMVLLFIFGGNNLYMTIGLASISAGNSVTLSKALAVFVKLSITVQNQLASLLPYCVLLFIIGSVILQVNRLNKAMETHKAYVVNSLYFVMLTTMSIINSTILYGDMILLTASGMLLFFSGCLLMCVGVFLLSAEKGSNAKDDEENAAFIEHKIESNEKVEII